MNTNLKGNGRAPTHHGKPALRPADYQEIHDLMADTMELLDRMAHVADPETLRLRAKVAQTLATAKRAVTEGAVKLQRQTRHAVRAGDDYVRDRPWHAVGIAAAAGLIAGLLVRRR
jgi:ElaB/YqjD/DUF883 family membrane-anchored ribosome-binding protein